jgi:hypothetical protein
MEEKQEQPKKNIGPKTIRTFSSDMAEAVRENQISVIKIAMAEKERQEQQEEAKKAGNSKSSKILFFIGSLIFIAGAIWGSFYLINQKKIKESMIIREKPRISTFINYDNAITIEATNINSLMSLISNIHSRETEEKNGSNAIFFMKKIEKDIEGQLNKEEFLSILKSTAPDALSRSMSESFLFGKYKGGQDVGTSSAFLIFGIKDYNLAYASMLDWEKSIFNDLFILFDITISDSDSALFEKEWRDVIVNNKDARVLYGLDGEGILYYSFVNKNTLVITENAEVLKRMINSVLVKNPQ